MPGLWKPFDHEKSAAKDRALKPAYQENFARPVTQKLPGSALSHLGLKFTSGGGMARTSVWYKQASRKMRDQVIEHLRRITNRHPIMIQGYKFAFKWNENDFAKANCIEREAAKRLFPKIQTDALDRRRLVERRVLRAKFSHNKELDPESGKQVEYLGLEFGLEDIKTFFDFPDGFRIEDKLAL